MSRAVELYYTIQEVELLLRLCSKTVIRKLKAREFGEGVVNLGSEERPDYRVPASGVNAFLERRRLFSENSPSEGIAARNVGELRRKAEEQSTAV